MKGGSAAGGPQHRRWRSSATRTILEKRLIKIYAGRRLPLNLPYVVVIIVRICMCWGHASEADSDQANRPRAPRSPESVSDVAEQCSFIMLWLWALVGVNLGNE
jgi:hypothetical protein